MIEQRRHARAPIDCHVAFVAKGGTESRAGIGRDISLGGMFVETDAPAAFGTHVTVHVHLPGSDNPFALPGIVRWVKETGMGVQFGLLGARETHVITEISRHRG